MMDVDAPAPIADRRPGLIQLIIVALNVTVIIRGVTWPLTVFIIGPVLGVASFGLSGTPLGKDAPSNVEAVLFLIAIIVTVRIVVGVHRDEERWIDRARWLGWVLAADTVFYVGSAVVAVSVWGGVAELADQALGLVVLVLVNMPIGWLGWRIAQRAHP